VFGTIYYKIAEKVTDFGGMQSLTSVIFMGGLFVAILVMMLAMPNFFKERAVFYRERASYMYMPEVYTLTFFLIEIPWVWFNVWVSITILYFMCGFVAKASTYFFFVFVVWIASMVFLAMGQLLSSAVSTMNAAQVCTWLLLLVMGIGR
jgi:hypothetical protein